MTIKQFSPYEDRVLVKHIKKDESEKTAGGIILDAKQTQVLEAVVVSVGVGFVARDTGIFVKTVSQVGETVLVPKDAGLPVDMLDENGEMQEYRLMREGEILSVLSEKIDL